MSRKYQPSNGTEGDIFFGNWCAHCERDRLYRTKEDEEGCFILACMYAYGINDPEYPEDIIIEEGAAKCTAFIPEGDPIPYRCTKTVDMFANEQSQ